MPFLKFDNLENYNAWHSAIMAKLGIPNDQGTLTYSEPIIHPQNGTVMAITDERGYTEENEIFTRENLYALGYLERPNVIKVE